MDVIILLYLETADQARFLDLFATTVENLFVDCVKIKLTCRHYQMSKTGSKANHNCSINIVSAERNKLVRFV
jgi:hypothetical protein